MSHARSFLPALFALALAAGYAADVAAQKALSPDEKELAAYTLTMPTVRKVAAVTRTFVDEASRDPKVIESQKLEARLDLLKAKATRTEAENAEMKKLVDRIMALEEEIDSVEDLQRGDQSLAEMEARLKKRPAVMRALAREGLTPREYVRCLMALFKAAIVEGFSQGKANLAALPPGISADHIRFIRENKTELDALQKEMAPKKK
jgi:TolA-binding protein